MESADFYETFGAIVKCPKCRADVELDLISERYKQGDFVHCPKCGQVFILGNSI